MHRIALTLLALGLLAITLPCTALAGDAEAGKATFQLNCASCHGPEGKGDGPVAVALDPKPRNLAKGEFKYDTDGDGTPGTDADLTNIVLKGAAAFGGSVMMAPVAISETDLANVIAYIRTLKE